MRVKQLGELSHKVKGKSRGDLKLLGLLEGKRKKGVIRNKRSQTPRGSEIG